MKKLFILAALLVTSTGMGQDSHQEDQNKVEPGIYEHFRGGGKRYQVIGTARFSEDPHKEFVIYQQLYESRLMPEGTKLPSGTLWARPIEMFLELVEDTKGNKVPRFKRVSEETTTHNEL
jgi:hypothetical protein